MGRPDNKRWIEAWQDDHILDFHQAQTNNLLIESWDHLELEKGARIFVPLCGKSLDMLWLADQGHEVIGVELSPIAVQDFFDHNKLSPIRSQTGPFTKLTAGNITILCGDFFSLKRKMLGSIDYIYDRASLTALPQSERLRYVRKVRALCNVSMLLLTVEDQDEDNVMANPSNIDEEIQSLYEKDYQIFMSLKQDFMNREDHLPLTQKAYIINPRIQAQSYAS